MGAAGSCFDNAIMEAFWARMQVELLNPRRWKTRVELASAIHHYIEHFHNTRRRHSALATRTPTEVEADWLRHDHQRGLARTAPNADEGQPLAAGLYRGQVSG
jgi:transposase InsO family protein